MSAVFLWILLIFCSCGLRRAQQSPCAKIDFNKPVVSGFQNCTKQYVPMFEVRNYVESPWLEPYRPSSQYFISNGVEGYSCGESVSRFQLDANSEIDAAIYLNFQFPGAFIEVLVIDTDSKQTINRWKNETAGGWFLLSRKINTNVRNAQVFYYIYLMQTKWLTRYINLCWFLRRSNFVPIQIRTVDWLSNICMCWIRQ